MGDGHPLTLRVSKRIFFVTKPFLKWAGNKYQIIRHIRAILETFPGKTRLIEPFAGSGAVFLNTRYPRNVLSDTNGDLIGLYQTLQAEGDDFIAYLRTFFTPQNNEPDRYYAFRELFNATTDRRLKSALFLYLNRHCFNGLCRYNGQQGFNVPFGRYKKPYFPEAELQAFYEKSRQAVFKTQHFETVMRTAKPGDIVYCDPPYVPLSRTANFTSYSTGGFTLADQQQLARLAGELSARGVVVLISNHNTEFTQALYHGAAIEELDVQRFISCKGANRGKAAELLALFTQKIASVS
jgi:DNA adenine methylase